MKPRSLLLLATVAALVAGPIVVHAARATDGAGQPRHPRLRAAATAMARRLDLTTEQKQALKEVRAQARDDLRSIRADPALTPAEKRQKARETLRVARQESRSKLQESQRQRLDRWRQRLRDRHLT
jgi:Spy/CpxP family protein refolding chaperone